MIQLVLRVGNLDKDNMKKLILLVLVLQSVVCFSQEVRYKTVNGVPNTPVTYFKNDAEAQAWLDNLNGKNKKVEEPVSEQYNSSIAPSDANYINLLISGTAPQPRQVINSTTINVNVTQPSYNTLYNNAMQPIYNTPMWQGSNNLVVPMILAPATPMKITTINVIKY